MGTDAVDIHPHTSSDGLEYLDEGSGPTLLLVHGSAAACDFWLAVIRALAADFRVVAPSLPGFGTSPCLAEPPHDLRPYADAVAALVCEIGAGPAVVVGHSLGVWSVPVWPPNTRTRCEPWCWWTRGVSPWAGYGWP